MGCVSIPKSTTARAWLRARGKQSKHFDTISGLRSSKIRNSGNLLDKLMLTELDFNRELNTDILTRECAASIDRSTTGMKNERASNLRNRLLKSHNAMPAMNRSRSDRNTAQMSQVIR